MVVHTWETFVTLSAKYQSALHVENFSALLLKALYDQDFHEMAKDNGNIGIRGFIERKQKKISNKMLLHPGQNLGALMLSS